MRIRSGLTPRGVAAPNLILAPTQPPTPLRVLLPLPPRSLDGTVFVSSCTIRD